MELLTSRGGVSKVTIVLVNVKDKVLTLEGKSDTLPKIELQTYTSGAINLLFLVVRSSA